MSDVTKEMEPMVLPNDADASGRDLGKEELALLKEVIESGVLNSTKGTMVHRLEAAFAERYGADRCIASSSGTAALHTAIGAINPEPGDEIITTPITDMGALTPILYQQAIPIFADVDPITFNICAETIEPKITDRTCAIMVTHLFGNPCDMGPIMDLAKAHDLVVIEDCAQAFFAEYNGKRVGTFGDIGCFSLQQGKHMTTGEGGLSITDNPELARRMFLFVNKAWGYGDENPDHYFLAPNYRMTELQGAVALAQLEKVEGVVDRRQRAADLMTAHLEGVPGIMAPQITTNSTHVYWKYCLVVDAEVLGANVDELAAHLKSEGIFSAPRYVQKPAFMCQIFRDRQTYGKSQCPYTCACRCESLPIS